MIFLFSLLTYFPLFAVSEEEIKISILKNFPLVEQATLKYEASRGEVEASRGAFDHKLSFKTRSRFEDKYDNQYFEATIERQTSLGGLSMIAGHRQGRGTFPAYDGKFATSGAGELFAGLVLPVLRNFQIDEMRLNLKLSKLKKSIARAELSLKQNIYLHKGLMIYYKWLFANQKLKIRDEVLKIAEERQVMLEKKFAEGDIERLKLTDNQRSIDKRRDELAKTKIEWQEAKTQLELYYRDETGASRVLGQDVLPVDDIKPITSELQTSTNLPQIAMIESEIAMLSEERKFHDQSRLPGLNLELLGARELSSNQPYDPDSLQVGVKFDFPLENRKASGKTIAAEYKYKALSKEKEFLQQSLKQQLDFTFEALKLSKTRWEVTNSEFQRTLVLSKAERTRWNQGDSDLYIVNLREQDAAEADIKRWGVWFEYHQLILDAQLFAGKINTATL